MSDDFSLFTSIRYDVKLQDAPKLNSSLCGWNLAQASPFYMLDLHRDRLLRAATHWQWQAAIHAVAGPDELLGLAQKAEEAVVLQKGGASPLRLRIVLDRLGNVTVEAFDTAPMPLHNLLPTRLPPPGGDTDSDDPARTPQYDLLVDREGISRSEHTHFKTTRREEYDKARDRVCLRPKDLKEVLIVDRETGFVMEGSISTPYFWRGGQWVTPPVASRFSWSAGSGGNDGTTRRWALEQGLAVEQEVSLDSLVTGEECWISNGVRGFLFCTLQL